MGGPRLFCMARAFRDLSRGGGTVLDDIESARAWLAERDGVDGDRIGVAGFCMGGGFALLYAARGSMRAAADYYGLAPGDAEDLDGVCPVLAGYGAKDTRFLGMPGRLTTHLDKLDVPHDIKVYPEAGHSYMNQVSKKAIMRCQESSADSSW